MADILPLFRQLLADAAAVLAAEAALARAELAEGARGALRGVLLLALGLLLAGLALVVAVAAAVLALVPHMGPVQASVIIMLALCAAAGLLLLAGSRALRAAPLLPRRSVERVKTLLGNDKQDDQGLQP